MTGTTESNRDSTRHDSAGPSNSSTFSAQNKRPVPGSQQTIDQAQSAIFAPPTAITSVLPQAVLDAAMLRALELAELGPQTGGNPRVGCVILDQQGHTISEGYHRGAGTPHAEAAALNTLSLDETQGAIAVVTLEPCNHTGRTGPCARALVDAQVAEVHFAIADPGTASAKGVNTLTAAGITTSVGLREDEAQELNHAWFTAIGEGRPYIILKWASTLDGRIAAADGSSQWITGPAARADVHLRRAQADAIAVGTGTALSDDPSLTARTPEGSLYEHQPIPVVIGERKIPDTAKLRQHPAGLIEHRSHDLVALLDTLNQRNVRTLFVEGGAELISAFLREGFGDELLVYLAPKLLGGLKLAIADLGITTIDHASNFTLHHTEQLGNDVLLVARKLHSPNSGKHVTEVKEGPILAPKPLNNPTLS